MTNKVMSASDIPSILGMGQHTPAALQLAVDHPEQVKDAMAPVSRIMYGLVDPRVSFESKN